MQPFDPMIPFKRVTVRRNEEGQRVCVVNNIHINYGNLLQGRYGDGWIEPSGDDEVWVEDDAEQIHTKLMSKLQDKEDYDAAMRLIDRMGADPEGAK